MAQPQERGILTLTGRGIGREHRARGAGTCELSIFMPEMCQGGALVFFLQRLDVSSYARSAEVRPGDPVLAQHAFCRSAATPDEACCLNVLLFSGREEPPVLTHSGRREREILQREAATLQLLRTKHGRIGRPHSQGQTAIGKHCRLTPVPGLLATVVKDDDLGRETAVLRLVADITVAVVYGDNVIHSYLPETLRQSWLGPGGILVL